MSGHFRKEAWFLGSLLFVIAIIAVALTDEQWARISPLLPAQKAAIYRPMLDHRCIVGGML